MKYNWIELDCQAVHAAQLWPVDKGSHEGLVTPAGVAALTYPYEPSPLCHSLTYPNNRLFLLPLSRQLTGSPGYYHTGHAQSFTYWYWFLFLSDLDSLYVGREWNRGSRWRAKDRILPGDRGWSLPSDSIHYCRLKWRSPTSHRPFLAAIQPHRSDSGPSHPKGDRGSETHCLFCGGGSTGSDWQPTALIKIRPPPSRIVHSGHAVKDV